MRKDYIKTVLLGLRFGMLLQLAVGPVCLMVLNTSAKVGFARTLPLIAAVTLADALYVALSCLGVAAVIGRPGVKAVIRFAGGAVLVLFGADTLLTALGASLLPGIRLFFAGPGGSLFGQGLLLTLSNPLTILFFSGMLSAKVAQNRWDRPHLFHFAAGCVLATVAFLTPAAFAGSLAGVFLPAGAIAAMNAAVGAALIYFGVRMVFPKKENGLPC